MKKTLLNMYTVPIFVGVVLAACSGGSKNTETDSDTTNEMSTVEATYTVDTDKSVVAWKGEVAGVYGHNGIIDVASGSISTKGEEITGGNIVIDMTSIVPLDSASFKDEEGARITDLQGHLMTGDFFLVEEFPTASFEIKSQNNNQLTGDLKIRGNTFEETVRLSSLEVTPEGLVGEGVLVFDRQKYEVNWKHFMQDYILSDDIEVKLNIFANNN